MSFGVQQCCSIECFWCIFVDNLERSDLRNGVNTGTQNYQQPPNNGVGNPANDENRRNQEQINRGLHETYNWYDACYTRRRNEGW